jgi:hypothetical protein
VGQAGDAFGAALAAGDFDDDGADDLAIGVPPPTRPRRPTSSSAARLASSIEVILDYTGYPP